MDPRAALRASNSGVPKKAFGDVTKQLKFGGRALQQTSFDSILYESDPKYALGLPAVDAAGEQRDIEQGNGNTNSTNVQIAVVTSEGGY